MIDNLVRHPRRITAAQVLLAIALVASACLAPTQFDPTGHAPIGNLELVANAAGGIRVRGWALDPDTSAPIKVKVGVAGVVREVTADLARPDVASAYPGKGPQHGFEYAFGPLDPGLRGICVWVENTVGAGADRLLGCDNIQVTDGSPIGNLESVTSSEPRSITVSGWTFDPSATASTDVVINVDGHLADRVTANGYRPDVGAVHGRASSGFHTEVAATPGSHQVCVAVFNVGFGEHRLLGCRTITVAESTQDRRPSGYLTEVVPMGPGSVRVRGVAQDPDGAAGLKVRLDVDAYPNGSAAQSITLNVTAGTFMTDITGLNPGMHTLCPVGLDVDGGIGVRGNRGFTCGSTVVGNVAVGTGGDAQNPTWVAPPPGTPLRNTSRDAGVSVRLRDGSTMWFFGDTLDHNQAGELLYFVNNTAAWAAADSPTVTRDAVATGGKPFQFVDATTAGNFCASSQYKNRALWPESAVAVPQPNGTDRVLVFMSKVCLGDSFLEIDGRGVALVEVNNDYVPGSPPNGTRIQGTVVAANLFGIDRPYGRASVLSDDGATIYAYQCGRFDPQDTSDWGPCTVGRVAVNERTNLSAWRYWNGGDQAQPGSWSADPTTAAPLQSPTGNDVAAPVSAFTLTKDPNHGAYVMVYSPWPGFTDRVVVRVAETPVGPFTDPVTVFLPGCNDKTGGVEYLCYAGTAQPALSKPGLLGIGYYDQLITPSPKRGQYMVVTVPFTVVLTASP